MKNRNMLFDAVKHNNLKELIHYTVTKHKDNVAFRLKNKIDGKVVYKDISYEQFGNDISYLGTAIYSLDLQGKRIAVIGPNSYDWVISYFATLNSGSIVVPLDKGLPPQEIESLLQRSYADAVIFAKEYENNMKEIMDKQSTKVKHFICMEKSDIEEFKNLQVLLSMGKSLMDNGDTRFENSEIDNTGMSIILFTSGTTSISKAVMLSHENIVSNVYAISSMIKMYETDVHMAFLPFHHCFGSIAVIFLLYSGSLNVFCDGLKYIQKNLQEYKVSVFICVPLLIEAMYKKIMHEVEKQGKTSLIKNGRKISNVLLKCKIDIRRKLFKQILDNLGGNLRLVVSGAAAIDKEVAKTFNDFGILTLQGYGLTETAPILSAENHKNIQYGSIGLPMCNVELDIFEPNSEGIGEIIAKGPNVMLGYYENEEATNEVLIDGWFHTGDLGYKDKKGFYFITGRKKNVVVLKNGKNVYPEEIEILINNLPYVAESMVFGLPKDDDLLLSAKIVYNKEYVDSNYPNISDKDLKDMIWKDIKEINSTLTTYKYIKNIIVTDEPMIKTTTSKVKRYEEIQKILQEK